MKIICLGYLVRGPLGGMAWHHLQYVAGLTRLGHDVTFIEDSDDYDSCYHPATLSLDRDPSYGLRFAARAFQRLGLPRCWGYYDAHTSTWHGPQGARIVQVCRDADLLLNVSGVNPMRPWFMNVPRRILIDTDPVFTQIRHLTEPDRRSLAEAHTAFLSFGESIGLYSCTIPDDGLPWQPTRQPVVLDLWPRVAGAPGGKITTVMQWDSYPAREWKGIRYGMKSESFQPYVKLPQRSRNNFELVVSGRAPRDELRCAGWDLRSPHRTAGDPWTYQRYIQRSKAEFSVAKHGYVVSRSGWFSERSALYLASGRPVIVQDTGCSRWLPTTDGVRTYNSPEEACKAIDAVNSDYEHHCRRAREIAEEYFDSKKVLTQMLDRVT